MTTTPYEIVNPFKIAIIGSGNWGTAVAKIISENTRDKPQLFQPEVQMWVFQEELEGKKLTDIINEEHENVKYLPGVKLPENLKANPDVVDTVKDADLLVFNIPHQFLPRVCKQLVGHVKPSVRALSCLKGLEVGSE